MGRFVVYRAPQRRRIGNSEGSVKDRQNYLICL
jgi:hypothetical protein